MNSLVVPTQASDALSVLGLSAPGCVDGDGWYGPKGSCREYERLGLCFDGLALANGTEAAAHCCACGMRSLRERCLRLDEHQALHAARVHQSLEPFVVRTRWIGCARERPLLYGWQPSRFIEAVGGLAGLLEVLLLAFLAASRRLLLLGLCGRVCDAALPAVASFLTAQRSLLDGESGEALDHASSLVAQARLACSGEGAFEPFVARLSEWAQHVEVIANQVLALALNLYFDVSWGDGGFVAHGHPQASKRWNLMLHLLGDMGCGARPCVFVEVGVFAGATSAHLLGLLPQLRVHGVDPYVTSAEYPRSDDRMYASTQGLFASFGDRAALHRNVSRDVAHTIGIVDLVFIDGSHAYGAVLEDLAAWSPYARSFAGHDLDLPNGDVARAVFEWSAGRVIQVLPDAVWFVAAS